MLVMSERGLQGLLDRTKTSGPGRRVRWLPIFVSKLAYYAVPGWLEAGYELWGHEPFAYDWDYL
eukprot:3701058-Lingulodinium_polyedra.AAC.1